MQTAHLFWATNFSHGLLKNSWLIFASPKWWFKSCSLCTIFWVVPFVLWQLGLEVSHRQKSAFGMRTWTSIWSIKYIHIHMCIYVYLCRHICLNVHINICCQNPHTLKLWETTFTLASLKQVRNESAPAVKVKLDLCCESFVESCSNKHA